MRPPQHNNNNKNRNRNRNRRHSSGGGGQSAGGSGANRVYDSNGPDVKLRGTAQTIAEKYMQLARDAHSSGDSVAAESYYQFADHYYRVWLAAQPVGQPIQFSRRMAGEEYDEDGNEQLPEGEGEGQDNESGDNAEPGEGSVAAEGGEGQPEGEGQNQGYQPRQNNRNFRDNNNNNNNNNNREGGNNRNFRQRWPRRNDRFNQDGQPNGNQVEGQTETGEANERFDRPERNERPVEDVVAQVRDVEAVETANWEAPSFLKRPTPVIAETPADPVVEEAPAPRPRGRKPRVVAPVEDAPQGE